MNFLNKFNKFKIHFLCKKYGIKDYTINNRGEVDVDGDVNISRMSLTKIPIKFGKVNGKFNCSYNQLRTLEKSPYYVGGTFDCSSNQLIDLNGCPECDTLNCDDNRLISIYCNNNDIKTTKGFPILDSNYSGIGIDNNSLPQELLNVIHVRVKRTGRFGRGTTYTLNIDVSKLNTILELQDEFMIWNSNNKLNIHNFNELLKEAGLS